MRDNEQILLEELYTKKVLREGYRLPDSTPPRSVAKRRTLDADELGRNSKVVGIENTSDEELLNQIKEKENTVASFGGAMLLSGLKAEARRRGLMESMEQQFGWPSNWDEGFNYPYRIAHRQKKDPTKGNDRYSGEVPFRKNGKLYIYVYNQEDGKNYYYSYSDDIFYPDTEFDNL
jgi:hypothetical protein